jgi:beta-lactamase class D
MKKILIVLAMVSWYSCSPKQEQKQEAPATNQEMSHEVTIVREDERPDLQQLFDSAKVAGAILIFDQQRNIFYSNNFLNCNNGFLPASTFKIPNSIIALETGVVESDSAILKWDGIKRRMPSWERDLTLHDAFHVSCVPCYQEIARKIGVERMKKYMKRFQYGKMEFDSTTLDLFWLEGESKITARQQIEFLKNFYYSGIGLSKRTEEIMKRMMVIDSTDGYKLSGKTGWAIRNNNNLGWFVGYIENQNGIYFFATFLEPKEAFNMDMFAKIRSDITLEAFKKTGILPG